MTTSCLPRASRVLASAVLALTALSLRAANLATFDIPAQSAPAALKLFSKQSGAQVVYIHDDLKSVTTKALKGEFEPADALAQLLDGSGFGAEPTGSGNFTIARQVAVKPGSIEGYVREEKTGRGIPGARVALAGTEQFVLTDNRGRFTITDAPSGEYELRITAESIQETKVTDVSVKAGHKLTLSSINVPAKSADVMKLEPYVISAKKNDGIVELDPYSVEGRRERPFIGASIDLMRTENDVLPFNTFSGAEIMRSGASNVEEFLRNRLASNYSWFRPEEFMRAGRTLTEGVNQINIVGAGAGSTSSAAGIFGNRGADEIVVLVNGRRLPNRYFGTAIDSAPSLGNIRGIPVASIERIEVLSSAASAIYGAGATGGVVNIITKQDYRGGDVSISYESPFDTDAPKRSVDASYVQPLGRGFSLRVGLSYSDTKPLTAGERSSVTIGRWRQRISSSNPVVFPFIVDNVFLPFAGTTPNIFNPGGPLFGIGSPAFTSVPTGYQGGQGLAPFLTRQGIYNLELSPNGIPGDSVAGQTPFGPSSSNRTLSLGIDKKFNDWRLTFEYERTLSLMKAVGPSGYYALFGISDTAPTNPFGQPVLVTLYDPQLDRPEFGRRLDATTDRATVSFRGKVGRWDALVDAAYVNDRTSTVAIGSADTDSLIVDAVNKGEYNPFVDTRVTSPAPASFYAAGYRRNVDETAGDSRSYQATVKLSGSAFHLPAGPLNLTGGMEFLRQERYRSEQKSRVTNSATNQIVRGFTDENPANRLFTFDTLSAFAETEVPVWAHKRFPLFQKAGLFGSGRVSNLKRDGAIPVRQQFNTSNGVTVISIETRPAHYVTDSYLYVGGVQFEPAPGFMIRASRSIGFRPPAFSDVVPALPALLSITATDRRTNQQVTLAPTMFQTGGNPALDPETTVSRNWGIVVTPLWLKGLRLSLDYVESIRNNAISSLAVQTVLNLEASDPRIASRVRRNASGTIEFIDATSINLRQIATKRADFAISQSIRHVLGGDITISATAARVISVKVQTSVTTAPQEQVRQPMAAFSPSIVEWNGNAQIRWDCSRWGGGWSIRYYDDILSFPHPIRSLLQGSDRIEDAFDHDFSVTLRPLNKSNKRGVFSLLDACTINVGVKNVFNRAPRFSPDFGEGFGGYALPDSVAGRSYWMSFQKSF